MFNGLGTASFRRASSLGLEVSSTTRDEDNGSTLEAAETNQFKTSSNGPLDSENIIIGDLAATLEAHRASNRVKATQKLNSLSSEDQSGRQQAPGDGEAVGSLDRVVCNGSGFATLDEAIIGRVLAQAKQRPLVKRIRGKRSRSQKKDVQSEKTKKPYQDEQNDLEYEARTRQAQGRWSQRTLPDRDLWRPYQPWLAYVDSVYEDRLDRLVK